MMKKNKILLVLGCMTLGLAGVGLTGALLSSPIQTKASTIQAKIWDFTSKVSKSTSYTNAWTYGDYCKITGGANNNGGWAYIRTGGKAATSSGTTLTSTYQSTEASTEVYTQIQLAAANISSGSGFTMNSITLTVASNSNFSTVIDTVAGVTVATSMTWTPTSGVTWASGSFYKLTFTATSTDTKNNRGMDVESVKFFKEGTVENPTSLSVSLASATLSSIGSTTTATATVLPESASDKTVSWSSSNENVAVVDAQGLVTAVGNGTVNIVATSNAVSSVTGSAQLTVSGITTAADKTITVARLGFGTSYVSGITGLDNVAYKYENAMKGISNSDCLQLKAGVGIFQNASAYASPIKRITILNNSAADIKSTLTVGTSTAAATATTFTRTSSTVVYDIASVGTNFTHFKLANASGNADYIKAIVVEVASSATINTDLDNARAFATTFLEETATECAALAVTSSNWSTIASLWEESFKTYFSDEIANSTYSFALTDIQKATERYSYIVKKYGYNNFMSVTLTPAYTVPFASAQEDTSALMYTLGGMAVLAAGTFFVFRKKKRA